MLCIDQFGLDITQLPKHEYSQITQTAIFLKDYLPGKKVLLAPAAIAEYDAYELAKTYKVDYIFQDQSSHNVELRPFNHNFEIPFYYLSGDLHFFSNQTNHVLFFPYWLFTARQFPNNGLLIGSDDDINRKYTFSSIARHPKSHRIYNFIKLRNKSYFYDKVCWTFHKSNYVEIVKDFALPTQEWDSFVDYYKQAPTIFEGEEECVQQTIHPAFLQSYINLTSETYIDGNFPSEKSFKPFLSGQFPMIYGTAGANKMLSDFGFDMYHDIIDHSWYDNRGTVYQRIDYMLDLLDRLVNLNFKEIFKETIDRRQKNKDYLYSQELTDLIMNPFISILKK